MNPGELTLLLDRLLAATDEHEWVEFKHNNDEPHAIGEYLSALANAAALDGEPFGYLVWGIENGSRRCWAPRSSPPAPRWARSCWTCGCTSTCAPSSISVSMRSSTAASRWCCCACRRPVGQPVSFHEVEYIRIHSAKVKLASHPDKEARLWARLNQRGDWSAELVGAATVADLDPAALAEGRQRYAEKNPHLADRDAQAGMTPPSSPSSSSAAAASSPAPRCCCSAVTRRRSTCRCRRRCRGC